MFINIIIRFLSFPTTKFLHIYNNCSYVYNWILHSIYFIDIRFPKINVTASLYNKKIQKYYLFYDDDVIDDIRCSIIPL